MALKTHHWTKAHLHPTHVLPDDSPSLSVGRSIRLCDANCRLLKRAAEKLEIGGLVQVVTKVVTQLDNDELWARRDSIGRSRFDKRRLGSVIRTKGGGRKGRVRAGRDG